MSRWTLLVVVAFAGCSRLASTALPDSSRAGAAAVPRPQATSDYATLHTFGAPPNDGNTPTTDLTLFNGLLWGTTYGGGSSSNRRCDRGCGTVYSINPYDPSGTNGYQMVYSFQGAPDGAIPEGGLNPNGNGDSGSYLYGTTFSGGKKGSNCYVGRGCGTVFSIDVPSSTEIVVYPFGGSPDGSNPSGGRHYVSGQERFYGTTQYGGQYGFGTVYWATPSGNEQVIYSFKGGTADGAYPVGDMTTKGCKTSVCKLYGVTRQGGKSNVGTIFEIDIPSGNETRLYSFVSALGDEPVGVTFASDAGTLYGAASRDGLNNRGSIFAFALSTRKFSVVHSFSGAAGGLDGSLPFAKPLFYKDAAYGYSLYGTTQGGGKRGGDGTIYRITLSDDRECIIHSFGVTASDGVRPEAPLREFSTKGPTLYGTTAEGPPQGNSNKGYGTVFKISPDAPPETEHGGKPLCFEPSGHRAR